ncbi:MAG: MMPL family transporter [Steroidobacteraceae bacterium]
MMRPGAYGTLIWALLGMAAAAVAARATYTADLSAFLPRSPSATQRLLVEQLRAGPAARLIMVGLEGRDAHTRALLSADLAQRLRADPLFSSVSNGDAAGFDHDREFLVRNRYLLSGSVTAARFTVSGLHSAIGEAVSTLASPEGMLLKPLFAQDPTGETLGVIDALVQGRAPHTTEGVWTSPDGHRALLLVQTRATGADTDGQEQACEALRRAFAEARDGLGAAAPGVMRLRMSGPPVFAVASRAAIRGEVVRLSTLGAALIAVLLLAAYRSLSALILGMLPVASGALAGVAAVALGYGTVHGITLGFGVTLIGEAVDYSIYLFIQRTVMWQLWVWPTMRLGVLTSICGFAVLLASSFPGLAQLGLYSIAGLEAAALVTRFVLPAWLPPDFVIADLTSLGTRVAALLRRLGSVRLYILMLPALAAVYLYGHRDSLWNHELSALSPIPAAAQTLDAQLRTDAGAPDARYMVVVSGADREPVLAACERLNATLTRLAARGVIGGFDSPARYLPSLATQRARQLSLPPPAELNQRLKAALIGLPARPSALKAFAHDVEEARAAPLLTPASLAGTALETPVGALLMKSASGWAALLPLRAAQPPEISDTDAARVRGALDQQPLVRIHLIDLVGETDRLYSGYLAEAQHLALVGFAAIVVLLAIALRSPARVLRVVAPLALAVITVAGLLVALGHELTILHVVGMLLIVAVGSNYALFFDRNRENPQHASLPLTLASLVVANLATVTAFGVLASSKVPVLADLGSTVAPGALLALLFCALLAHTPDCAPAPGARP